MTMQADKRGPDSPRRWQVGALDRVAVGVLLGVGFLAAAAVVGLPGVRPAALAVALTCWIALALLCVQCSRSLPDEQTHRVVTGSARRTHPSNGRSERERERAAAHFVYCKCSLHEAGSVGICFVE